MDMTFIFNLFNLDVQTRSQSCISFIVKDYGTTCMLHVHVEKASAVKNPITRKHHDLMKTANSGAVESSNKLYKQPIPKKKLQTPLQTTAKSVNDGWNKCGVEWEESDRGRRWRSESCSGLSRVPEER
ncbi:hypothetical protein VIGAN_04266100 [Vigna angularis var. angularis]|uniref:Uncharacterized protein n=1 Tax=Vigna angularis var. angularis TaxID=157739 RepID=A0A0S3RX24_PHAAN|nr:hypothetical protein VIGAN_04266100 [Vigna angularis var. angularis]